MEGRPGHRPEKQRDSHSIPMHPRKQRCALTQLEILLCKILLENYRKVIIYFLWREKKRGKQGEKGGGEGEGRQKE